MQPSTEPARAAVLIVDDDEILRSMMRATLEQDGFAVTEAIDGEDAVECCSETLPDLVIADVVMPRMDGYELTRTLRATAEYANVPIVMVTSKGERIDRVRGFDAGVDEYITKPHDRQQLLEVVRKLLGHAGGGG